MKDREQVAGLTSAASLPEDNARCYALMYAIENGIRELIIEELSSLEGALWYKHRLPGDTLKKYREAVLFQRQVVWTKLVPHHPVYYLDFPDLRKIIEREDNWKDVFSSIFTRKDLISATLAEIEPTRNSLAHNRKLTRQDVAMLEATCLKLESAIGMNRFRQLCTLTTASHSIQEDLDRLKSALDSHLQTCIKCEELKIADVWRITREQWWFDESYLGHPTEPIDCCFELLAQYSRLPRHRGSGHAIESWVNKSELPNAVARAVLVLQTLINSTNVENHV